MPACTFDKTFDVAHDEPCLYGNLLPSRRYRHAAIGSVNQLRIESRLQLLDGVAERRLRDEAALRGMAEMPGFREGQEILQLFDCGRFHMIEKIAYNDTIKPLY